jgi:hypothetical protein
MASSENVKLISGEAGSAVVVYRVVTLAADGQYDHAAGATSQPAGICAESQATVGKVFPIASTPGAIVKVEVGAGDATRGARVGLLAAGKVTDATLTVGNWVLGQFLDAGVDGDIVRVLLQVDLDQVT